MASAPPPDRPAAVVIGYNPPLPLVRVPIQGEDGRWKLAFRSEADKAAARASCRAAVAANCEDGARFGAGVAAAATCAATRRGFWVVVAERMTGRGPRLEEDRVACEVREAEIFTRDAAARCGEHAASFCEASVGGTPVAAEGQVAQRFRRGEWSAGRRSGLLWS